MLSFKYFTETKRLSASLEPFYERVGKKLSLMRKGNKKH
jgi:hypothetical protein